jgi:hypothetical protein
VRRVPVLKVEPIDLGYDIRKPVVERRTTIDVPLDLEILRSVVLEDGCRNGPVTIVTIHRGDVTSAC